MIASALFAAVPARADLCVIVNPLLSVGCGGHTTSPGSNAAASSTPTSTASATDESVALSATTTEYDPERIAVTINRRASPRQVAAAFAGAGVELEQAVRQIHAYLVRVSPERQAAAVRALRASPVVVRAGPDVIAHALDDTQ